MPSYVDFDREKGLRTHKTAAGKQRSGSARISIGQSVARVDDDVDDVAPHLHRSVGRQHAKPSLIRG